MLDICRAFELLCNPLRHPSTFPFPGAYLCRYTCSPRCDASTFNCASDVTGAQEFVGFRGVLSEGIS